MKRIISLLLAMTFLVALAATPTLAQEIKVNGAVPKEVEQLSEELAASPAPEEADPAETGAVEAGTADPIEKAEAIVQNADKDTPFLRFGEIRKRLLSHNPTVQQLSAQEDELNDMDTSFMSAGITQLKTLQSGMAELLTQVEGVNTAPPQGMELIYGSLYALLQANTVMLKSQIDSMESQIDSLETSQMTGANSINDGINQVVKGVETLYIGIITIEAGLKDMQRGIDTLDRAVAILEKQHELGMASAYDVESIKHQRSSVLHQKESLEFQLMTSKMTLENMCGYEIKGTIQLESLTMPTAEELAAVDYDKTVQTARSRNVKVMNAHDEWWNDTTGSDAKALAVDAAEADFDVAYKIVCLSVGDKMRLEEAARETVTFQEKTFEIEAKKYELGMISHEEYMTAKNNLEQARSDLFTAQLNLFTAYRNYIWGKQYGIV